MAPTRTKGVRVLVCLKRAADRRGARIVPADAHTDHPLIDLTLISREINWNRSTSPSVTPWLSINKYLRFPTPSGNLSIFLCLNFPDIIPDTHVDIGRQKTILAFTRAYKVFRTVAGWGNYKYLKNIHSYCFKCFSPKCRLAGITAFQLFCWKKH